MVRIYVIVVVCLLVCAMLVFNQYGFMPNGLHVMSLASMHDGDSMQMEKILQEKLNAGQALTQKIPESAKSAESRKSARTNMTDYSDELAQDWRSVPVLDAPTLPRLMSGSHLRMSVEILVQLTALFGNHGIEYVLCYGTLLGSYVAHSVLAWDDDVDIVIHARDQHLLSQLDKGGVLAENNIAYLSSCMLWSAANKSRCAMPKTRFWSTDAIYTKYKWRYPYINVINYDSNSSHVWMLNVNSTYTLPINTFYPLQKRPLNGLWFSAPREPYAFLVANYWAWNRNDTDCSFVCSWPRWNHWAETNFLAWRKADCATLLPYYPFVRRSRTSSGQTREELILNNITYYSVLTSETFKPEWQPQPHRLEWHLEWPREKKAVF